MPDNTLYAETHLKDHLGNVRIAYSIKNGSVAVKQSNSYYPFGMNIKELSLNETFESSKPYINEYKYNGKMFQDEIGLNWYDYGARFYDPVIARWHSPDPLAEKFFCITPFAYCANNPIRYFDPTGMEFSEDAWKWVNKMMDDIKKRMADNNKTIEEKKAQLKSGGLSERKEKALNRKIGRLESQNTQLESVKSEVAILAASDQMYDVKDRSTSTGTYGNTSYDNTTGNVIINVFSNSSNPLATFAHELKHAYQFETGALSLSYSGNLAGSLYDITDEIEAYKRGQLFGANASVYVDENWIRSLGYSKLPTGPIDTNTLTGNPLNPTETYLQAINNSTNLFKSLKQDPFEVIKR